ncbi:MAG: PH domain-containing protein [Ketobacteraceae bacterium]|nr:PH domain-containing protein [Ketobacteraceae bacterium]
MIDNFSNQTLSAQDLPSVADLDFQPLSPHYVKVVVIQLLLATLLPLAALVILFSFLYSVSDGSQGLQLTVAGAVVAALSALAFVLLAIWIGIREARYKAYCLREHDLVFRHGLLIKRRVVQPLLRVQHVEVSQNPMEARWGLATLKLFSAGGFRYTFAISGLEKPLAEKLHQLVVSYQETHHE